MQPLNEAALRKPEFEPGIRIKLFDGQEWEIPRPRFTVFPQVDERGVEVVGNYRFGQGLRSVDVDPRRLPDPENNKEMNCYQFDRMVRILGLNYDLTGDHYRLILGMEGDADSLKIWAHVRYLLSGGYGEPESTA